MRPVTHSPFCLPVSPKAGRLSLYLIGCDTWDLTTHISNFPTNFVSTGLVLSKIENENSDQSRDQREFERLSIGGAHWGAYTPTAKHMVP